MTLGIDFDHTLVEGDVPLPGAKDALQRLHDAGHIILIHSCNNPDWIRRVLNNNEMYYDGVWEGQGKPVCDWYIDDRAIPFNGSWGAVLEASELTNE